MCVRVVAPLPQRLKSTFFEKFSNSTVWPFKTALLEKFQKMLILSLRGKQCNIVPKSQLFPCFRSLFELRAIDALPGELGGLLAQNSKKSYNILFII